MDINDKAHKNFIESNGHWKSSTGDFGLHTCIGTVTNNKEGKNLDLMFIVKIYLSIDYFIMKIYRDSE